MSLTIGSLARKAETLFFIVDNFPCDCVRDLVNGGELKIFSQRRKTEQRIGGFRRFFPQLFFKLY